jgi:signal transduction histidine kinase
MLNEKWTNGMACMALGAVAAYVGMWTVNGGGALMPMIFSLAAALAGVGLVARRRPAPDSASAAGGAPAAPPDAAADAALLGHEMKNYLCTLKGNAILLRQRVPSNDQIILDRIDRVVEKLESFTWGLSGARNAATSAISLSPVRPADAARACVRTHFHRHAETFACDEGGEPAALLCDPGRLEQVFLNLYANSLEAGARHVETRVRRVGERLVVRIEDDGRGCAREDLERIFEPFFTTKQGPARRGLGMFIVQSIVENHGGRIAVGTKNGSAEGSTGLVFTLDFPLARSPASIRQCQNPVTAPATENEWFPRATARAA